LTAGNAAAWLGAAIMNLSRFNLSPTASMKKIARILAGPLLALFVLSMSPLSSQLRANYSYTDNREPPGDPEAHTYHVHVVHYYETWGYYYDSYSWEEDYDETAYTNPGDTIEAIDHCDEDSGNDGQQYYYTSASYTYS